MKRLAILFGISCCVIAAPENGPFLQKYNAFCTQMNVLTDMLQHDVADLKQFRAVDKAWKELHDDPGWMNRPR